MSALSGFCRFLMKENVLSSNPVKLVAKPKVEKRLPAFFKAEAMNDYLSRTSHFLDPSEFEAFLDGWHTKSGKEYYDGMLSRMIIAILYSLGLRRAELIGLTVGDVDFGRNVVKVRGKGDKMREIPLIASLSQEILLYLKAVETMCGGKRSLKEPLLVTYKGSGLYPAYVDKAVKSGLKGQKGITGRKSPHVLRHSLATELMNDGTDIFSIKEMLGHSSLATTQIYTHSSIAQLKHSYEQAHPRAKNGGKNGD
jgi:integrase/recombinase XerC